MSVGDGVSLKHYLMGKILAIVAAYHLTQIPRIATAESQRRTGGYRAFKHKLKSITGTLKGGCRWTLRSYSRSSG